MNEIRELDLHKEKIKRFLWEEDLIKRFSQDLTDCLISRGNYDEYRGKVPLNQPPYLNAISKLLVASFMNNAFDKMIDLVISIDEELKQNKQPHSQD